jgi:hypothetical protein
MTASARKTLTSILYEKKTYRGIGFTEEIRTINDVKLLINESTEREIKQPYTVEIEDEGEYVQLIDIFLKREHPWREQESRNGNEPNVKIIKLKINEIKADISTSRIYKFAV